MVAPAAMLATVDSLVSVATSEVFEQTTSGTLWTLCKTASGFGCLILEPTMKSVVGAKFVKIFELAMVVAVSRLFCAASAASAASEALASSTRLAICMSASVLGSEAGVDEPTREVEVAAVAMAVTVAAAAVEVLGVDVMLRSRPASTMLMEDTLLSALIRLAVVV